MERDALLSFIAKAHQCTYAAPRAIKREFKVKPFLPEHTDFDFSDGEWGYHDSYAGQLWPPGKEVVFYKRKPVWCMSYQGKALTDDKAFVERVYGFLKQALLQAPDDAPFRGPEEYCEDEWRYSFTYEGDASYFVGREVVEYQGEVVFFQDVMGTLIK